MAKKVNTSFNFGASTSPHVAATSPHATKAFRPKKAKAPATMGKPTGELHSTSYHDIPD